MIWLVLLSPFIILIPIMIYFDKRGASQPRLDSENHRIEQDQAKRDSFFTHGGGDGPGGST
ncbi:hypothetical protein ACFYKX_05670 [Cytobacillus sp. FJAT-54145]|uniref:Uncharacterized protein n=1 Tax=Cytobacillus spartinae TaxID=3299023 RepID=A0ABW6K7F3_9BACI